MLNSLYETGPAGLQLPNPRRGKKDVATLNTTAMIPCLQARFIEGTGTKFLG